MNKLWMTLIVALWIPGVTATESPEATYTSCISCHGKRGEGNLALKAPALAGQSEDYLLRQLNHFRSGLRGASPQDTGGMQMAAMAKALPAQESVVAVAAYISGLPTTADKNAPQADLVNGNNYYEALCGACHGGRAQGNDKLKAPRLAGLNTEYMKLQYANFKLGIRGGHAQDKFGKRMGYMTSSLDSDKDLDDVLAYIVSMGSAE